MPTELNLDETSNLHENVVSFLQDNILNLKKQLEASPENILSTIKRKMDEISEEEEEFRYKTIVFNLILIYEYVLMEDYDEALAKIKTLEAQINVLDEKKCSDKLYQRISVALKYLISSFKLYAILNRGDEVNTDEILKNVKPVSKMEKSNQAGMNGISATMLMEYGPSGTRLALFYTRKAIELDPDNAYWHFLLGKILGRCRRLEKRFEIPSDEEISAFRKTIQLEKNYLYLLFTAEVFAEFANRVYTNNRWPTGLDERTSNTVNEMNKEANEFFRKSYELRPQYVQVLFRAAKGLMKLPNPYKDIKSAKLMLEKGLEKAPENPMGNHLMAQLCEHYLKDMDSAIRYLKICIQSKVFGAHVDMIRISFHHKEDFDIEALENMLSVYNDPAHKAEILLQLVSYHIFIKNNLIKACEYFRECMKLDFQRHVKNFRCIFLKLQSKISLAEVLMDEIKLELENDCSEDEMSAYQKILNDLAASSIEIPKGRVRNLKKGILEKTQKFKFSFKDSTNNTRATDEPSSSRKIDKDNRKTNKSFGAWKQGMNRNTNWRQQNYRNNNRVETHERLNTFSKDYRPNKNDYERYRPKRDNFEKNKEQNQSFAEGGNNYVGNKGRGPYFKNATCSSSNNSVKPSLEEQLRNLNIQPRKGNNS